MRPPRRSCNPGYWESELVDKIDYIPSIEGFGLGHRIKAVEHSIFVEIETLYQYRKLNAGYRFHVLVKDLQLALTLVRSEFSLGCGRIEEENVIIPLLDTVIIRGSVLPG